MRKSISTSAVVQAGHTIQKPISHNCTQLMETETITTYRQGMTVGPDGAMHPSLHTTVIPSKRAYTCDDGVTYWR